MESATYVLIFIVLFIIGVLIFASTRRRPSNKRIVYWTLQKLIDIERKATPGPVAAKELAYFHLALHEALGRSDVDQIGRRAINRPVPDDYALWESDDLPHWGLSSLFDASATVDGAVGQGSDFWDLGKGSITVPGMWNLLAGEMMVAANMPEQDIAATFVALNCAMSDAGVVGKRDGLASLDGAFAASAVDVLSHVIEDRPFTTSYNGRERTWDSFAAMAADCGSVICSVEN